MALFSALILSSCCEEIPSGVFGYDITILQDPDDIVKSDKIFAKEITYNNEKRVYLYNVTCSLRNDDSPEKIIKKQVSEEMYSGFLAFGFTTWKKESVAQWNNTSKYFITINDPDLDGYDPNYETVKQYCHRNLERTIYLGSKKAE